MKISNEVKAIFNGKVLAESDKTIVIESSHYFPPDSVKTEYLQKSGNTYQCTWKGTADYYNVVVDDKTDADAAWMYPEPADAAKQIKGYFAFWKEVEISD